MNLIEVLGKIQAKAVPELENKRSDNGFIFKSPCPIRIHSIQPDSPIEPQK